MLDGITSKLTKNAELLAILASGWQHSTGTGDTGGGFGSLMAYLQADFSGSHNGPLNELREDMRNPSMYWWKLWSSGHLYSSIFKFGLVLWGAGELGIYNKYKSLGEKLVKAGAISAAIFQGSGPVTGFNTAQRTGLTAGSGSYRGASNSGGGSNIIGYG